MKIYKITRASEYLGVSINTLKTLANNGKIKSFKTTGKHRRFRQEDLDAYMGVEKEKQEMNNDTNDGGVAIESTLLLDFAAAVHSAILVIGETTSRLIPATEDGREAKRCITDKLMDVSCALTKLR